MAVQVPTLNIAEKDADLDLVIDIPVDFDQVVGRDRLADITVPDPAMSRRHARLSRGTDDVWLEDLGSTNGTYINGDRVTVPRRLRDGDELKLGSCLAIFHEVAAEPEPTLLTRVWDGRQLTMEPDRPSRLASPRDSTPSSATPADPQEVVMGAVCAGCSSTNRPDAWFCAHCGHQQRPVPLTAMEPSSGGSAGIEWPVPHRGNIRRRPFRQAMRAGNGGRRLPYNERLATATIVFRASATLLLLAFIVISLVALAGGGHHLYGPDHNVRHVNVLRTINASVPRSRHHNWVR
jgi:hypothetical protein